MKLLGYAGRLFADLHVKAGWTDGAQNGPYRSVTAIARGDAVPAYGTMDQQARLITASFIVKATYDTEETLTNLLGALDPNSAEPRPLLGEIEIQEHGPS